MSVAEGVEKRKPSDTVAGNVNWHSHCREQYGNSSKRLKLELPYDPAMPLVAKHPDNAIIQKDTCSILKEFVHISCRSDKKSLLSHLRYQICFHILRAIFRLLVHTPRKHILS